MEWILSRREREGNMVVQPDGMDTNRNMFRVGGDIVIQPDQESAVNGTSHVEGGALRIININGM